MNDSRLATARVGCRRPLSGSDAALRLTLAAMKATLTSKGRITIPAKIRKRLGIEPGQVLDFDEEAPFLKAIPVFDEDAMRAVRGCARHRLGVTADEWLAETRD